jgi:hypothetical protein
MESKFTPPRVSKPNSSSKYVGVHWDINKHAWTANIQIRGKRIFLGRRYNEEEAAQLYINAKKMI